MKAYLWRVARILSIVYISLMFVHDELYIYISQVADVHLALY